MAFPSIVQFETTTVCNENCWFCPRSIMSRKKNVFMEDWMIDKIFDELSNLKGVQIVFPFLYGEPFMDPRMFGIIDSIHRVNAKAIIYSNSTCLSEEISQKIIDCKLDSLILTLTGKETTTGPVAKKVLKFLEMKGESLPKTSLKVIRKDGRDQKFMDFWKKVPDANPWISGVQSIAGFNFKPDKTNPRLQTVKGCNRMIGIITILVNGDVCLCCNDYNCTEYQGNIKNQTMEEIYSGKEHKRLLEVFPNIKICQYCEDGSRF